MCTCPQGSILLPPGAVCCFCICFHLVLFAAFALYTCTTSNAGGLQQHPYPPFPSSSMCQHCLQTCNCLLLQLLFLIWCLCGTSTTWPHPAHCTCASGSPPAADALPLSACVVAGDDPCFRCCRQWSTLGTASRPRSRWPLYHLD